MSDTNPYAPPNTDPQSNTELPWTVDGTGILVRNGTVLPQVDLETGEIEPDMVASARRHETVSPVILLPTIAIVAGYVLLKDRLAGITPIPFLIGGGVLWFLYSAVQSFRGTGTPGGILITEYFSAARVKRRKKRLIGLVVGTLVFFGGLLSSAALVPMLLSLPGAGKPSTMLRYYIAGVFLAGIGMVVWAVVGREKVKPSRGPKGWLRIRPVHPEALAFLREREREMLAEYHRQQAAPKLRVHTAYYHRYSIRELLGGNRKPLVVLTVVAMKWLKSRRLEKEIYDSSEAKDIPFEELRESLRVEASAWLETHPGWSVIRGKALAHPTLPHLSQEITLASADLSVTLWATQTWNDENSAPSGGSLCFNSWLDGGTLIRTWNGPTGKLIYPNIQDHQAAGTTEEIFQAHLARLEGKSLVIPADREELLGRIKTATDEIERVMIEGGYRSATRDSA